MNIQIHLQNGITLTAFIENYNAEEFATQINSQNLAVVHLGDYIFSKHLIAYIAPAPETEE